MAGDERPAGARVRTVLTAASRPALARHARLRLDPTRDTWLLLAPERILTPSETAVDVLQRCDGVRSIEAIAAALAVEYDAPREAIAADILPLLQDLADKGYIVESNVVEAGSGPMSGPMSGQ